MALHAAVALCALLAALLVYRYDLYEREPWYMLLMAVAVGAVTMRLVGAVELLLLVSVEGAAATAAGAALIEELSRLAALVAISAVFPSQFNDPMDGLVYGSIIGLGMGLEESHALLNVLAEPNILTLPVELVRLLGHLVLGGMVGFGIGLVRAGIAGWSPALGRCLLVAVALHFLWDWLALEASGAARMSFGQTAAAVAIMLAGASFYGALVVAGSKLSRDIFAPHSSRTVWGWPFTALFEERETED